MDRPWSADENGARLVERELIAVFREQLSRPIYSIPGGKLASVCDAHMDGLQLLAMLSTFFGRDSFDRLALLTWARAQAGGPSVSQVCLEKGWRRTTFEEARRRAALLVAIGLHGVAAKTILLAEAV